MMWRIKKFINHELNQLAYNLQRIDSLGNPVVYQIELTNHCPMTCGMCPRTNLMKRDLGYMDENLFQKIIQEVSEYSDKIFFHHFGDSLVHPKLGDFIRYANEYNIKSYLSANPALLTKKRAQELVDNGLHELVLSLDGVTSATSALVRGDAARNVDLAEKNVKYLLEYRKSVQSKAPFLIMQIVRQKQNIHEVEQWLEKWQAVEGIDRIKVKSYITWDGQDEFINSLRLEDLNNTKPQNIVCDKPWTSVTILWDGRVVPCCFDYDGIYTLGDLRKQSLQEIWTGERIRYLRQCHKDGNLQNIKLCEQCTDREGYPVKRWYYPLNRIFTKQERLGDEWQLQNKSSSS